MRVTLVRHSEVEKEFIGCYNGHNNIGLSENGKNQAKELAKKLDSQEFDAVFCSDLPRAKETLKHSLHVNDAIYTDKLREKSWGRHEGLSFDEIIAKGEIEYIDFLQWIQALDGEPYEEYKQRVKKFFTAYLPSLKKEHILVVTHAGVIRTLLTLKKNISLEEAFKIKIDYGDFIIENI
ncbi:MAG: alpha-ribazole phosphatase family protein [Sulfurimonas sp.]|uniref:alpha-ribazole phosphatase family protein n=1 Tax=Sulfurimonas sp. TaxID=2022749 RepID=UPI00261CAF1E|nr:alpha-ribazole phosphatase family protein [Sulfurimonas sp.]MCW8894586.1 alpha-ribazole phosphatase family protein [Sulfurimonas sp.]MCW8953791.1 alpha-ribazole phosphatase family protein [Sulfurimonas sp.]MCW9068021.1 alpha-ribazole phosphatase family protein [Sulfurimonas sp.]